MADNFNKNIFGEEIETCSKETMTGYLRNGSCETLKDDIGSHTVCAIVTDEFLEYSRDKGNDLITPNEAYRFPGLVPGDKWCLCVLRWKEAYDAGKAPKVNLEGTHEKALNYVKIDQLIEYALK